MSKNLKERNLSSETDRGAIEWVSKVDRGLSPAEQRAFDRWRQQSQEHKDAFDFHLWNWEQFDRLAGLQSAEATPVDANLLLKRKSQNHFLQEHWQIIGMAAAMLIALTTLVFNYVQSRSDNLAIVNDKGVNVERIEVQELQDGSSIQLNHDTELIVNYGEESRIVDLLRGEAHFIVAKDENRPFIVQVSGIQLIAVGTAFNVRMSDDVVDVIVTEGRVALNTLEGNQAVVTPLQPLIDEQHRAIVSFRDTDAEYSIQPVEASVMEEELLWQPKLISFDSATLSEIVDEFNRRNSVNMLIVDSSLKEARLSSMFWSDNLNGFVRLLESNFGVSAEWGEDGTIYLFNKTQNSEF